MSTVAWAASSKLDLRVHPELRLDDDRGGPVAAEGLVDVPERARPDLTVGVRTVAGQVVG